MATQSSVIVSPGARSIGAKEIPTTGGRVITSGEGRRGGRRWEGRRGGEKGRGEGKKGRENGGGGEVG